MRNNKFSFFFQLFLLAKQRGFLFLHARGCFTENKHRLINALFRSRSRVFAGESKFT